MWSMVRSVATKIYTGGSSNPQAQRLYRKSVQTVLMFAIASGAVYLFGDWAGSAADSFTATEGATVDDAAAIY